jgi:hypothetical protein
VGDIDGRFELSETGLITDAAPRVARPRHELSSCQPVTLRAIFVGQQPPVGRTRGGRQMSPLHPWVRRHQSSRLGARPSPPLVADDHGDVSAARGFATAERGEAEPNPLHAPMSCRASWSYRGGLVTSSSELPSELSQRGPLLTFGGHAPGTNCWSIGATRFIIAAIHNCAGAARRSAALRIARRLPESGPAPRHSAVAVPREQPGCHRRAGGCRQTSPRRPLVSGSRLEIPAG